MAPVGEQDVALLRPLEGSSAVRFWLQSHGHTGAVLCGLDMQCASRKKLWMSPIIIIFMCLLVQLTCFVAAVIFSLTAVPSIAKCKKNWKTIIGKG